MFFRPSRESFAEQLDRFGPSGTVSQVSLQDAYEYCRQLACSHYENFHVASLFLPKELRRPFHVVYAYCRWSDDLADEHDGSLESRERSVELLQWWSRQLDACFDGQENRHPVFVALNAIRKEFQLSRGPFADLLIAFQRDQAQLQYATLEELLHYCHYSADPVGRIVLQLVYGQSGQSPSARQLNWSDSICTGLQLANFWQDVSRDIQMGRNYIPIELALYFEVDPDQMQDTPSFRAMLKELVYDARKRLLYGVPLIESVPARIRLDIDLFIRGGLAILNAIESSDYAVLHHRPKLTRWNKLQLLAGAWLRRKLH